MTLLSQMVLPMVSLAQACQGGSCGSAAGYGAGRGFFGSMMGYGGGGWGLGSFGMVFFLIFWILVIVAIVYFIKHLIHGGHHRGQSDENTSEILKKRFAKGEITKEDYERMKKELEKM